MNQPHKNDAIIHQLSFKIVKRTEYLATEVCSQINGFPQLNMAVLSIFEVSPQNLTSETSL